MKTRIDKLIAECEPLAMPGVDPKDALKAFMDVDPDEDETPEDELE
jgi:hypothetical protein